MVDFSKFNTEEYKRKREIQLRCDEIRESFRLKTCGFTGHRPDKLPGGYDWWSPENKALGFCIRDQVIELIEKRGVRNFIFGGALGVDQMSFAVCHKLKETRYPYIKLILAMPFEKQDAVWKDRSDKAVLAKQRELADMVVMVDELPGYSTRDVPTGEYHPDKLKRRNEYIVDYSNYLLAVWDGSKGGTYSCVSYAYRLVGSGRTVIRWHPSRLDVEFRYC